MQTFIVLLALFAAAQARLPELYSPEETRENDLDSRIVGGFPAEPSQFPHQAFLLLARYDGHNTSCGGSLISRNWVLTAAHCLTEMIFVEVHLGNNSFADSPLKIKSDNLHIHPYYDGRGLRNDVGLVGLPYSVNLTANIQTIRLALEPSQTYLGREALVSGYGYTSDTSGVSPILNFAPVKIINNTDCLWSCPTGVRDSVVCAVGVETVYQGSCFGDSGGPMVLRDNGVLRQIGIVSFSCSANCHDNLPKGYARPNHFIPWISEVTGITFD